MPNITTFDPSAAYIYIPILVYSADDSIHEFDAIFDTGAPRTEFSDRALQYAGFLEATKILEIPDGLQTQKYNRLILPEIQICGHKIAQLNVFVSHFEKSWGIDALIGLYFLRMHRIEIDYSKGLIVTEKLS